MDSSTLTFDERDEFSRKPIAEKIITLLQSEIDISPMLIDGGWGTGKSEFCHKLINLLKEQDTHHLIYIDAFKADHANEPLMTVLAEVINVLPDDETKKNFTKKALPILRYTLKTVAKAGVSHLLRQDVASVVDEFDKEIQEVAGKAIDLSVMGLLNEHIESEKSLTTLKDALKEITEKKPIAIFIDELDRCRPNFAVDMLEIIKHIFDTSAMNFVLITNIQQLKASINHCYGISIDAQKYLDKFIKFSFELPVASNQKGVIVQVNVSTAHYNKLVLKNNILSGTALHRPGVDRFMHQLIKAQDYSLREVETLVRHLEIYQVLTSKLGFCQSQKLGQTLLRSLGLTLFCFNKKITKGLLAGKLNAKEFIDYFDATNLIPSNGIFGQNSDLKFIVARLAQEYKIEDLYLESEPSQREWDRMVFQYFGNDSFNPRTDILDPLRVLSFYNSQKGRR